MGVREHKEDAKSIGSARCAIITVSDTRTEVTDQSGKQAISLLKKAKHKIVLYKLIKNNSATLTDTLKELTGKVDLIVTIGGTGISKKDISIEVVEKLVQKKLYGFGELFRNVSHKEIGTASIMSRALLGVRAQTLILALPGSSNAVKIAIDTILLPELRHLIWELKRY